MCVAYLRWLLSCVMCSETRSKWAQWAKYEGRSSAWTENHQKTTFVNWQRNILLSKWGLENTTTLSSFWFWSSTDQSTSDRVDHVSGDPRCSGVKPFWVSKPQNTKTKKLRFQLVLEQSHIDLISWRKKHHIQSLYTSEREHETNIHSICPFLTQCCVFTL